MPRLEQTVRVISLTALLTLGLLSCTGDEPTPDDTTTGTAAPSATTASSPTPEPTGTATPTETTTPAPTPSPTPTPLPPPETVITVGPIDPPLSQAEIRVGEIIVEFDGKVTDEGTVLTLEEPILFDFGSSELRSSADEALDHIAEVLAFYSDAPVIVEGHTDSISSEELNQALSQDRADAVTSALVDRDIAAGRMTSEGRGETEPVAPNENEDGSDNPDGRARNRRVEVLVVGVEPPVDGP